MRRITCIAYTVVPLLLNACAPRDMKPGIADPSGFSTATFWLSCPIETNFLDAPNYLMIHDQHQAEGNDRCSSNIAFRRQGYVLIDVTDLGVKGRTAYMFFNRGKGEFDWDAGMPKYEFAEQREKAREVYLNNGGKNDEVGLLHSAYRPTMVYEWKVEERISGGRIRRGSVVFHGATDTALMFAGLKPELRRRLVEEGSPGLLAGLIANPRNNIRTLAQVKTMLASVADNSRYAQIVAAVAGLDSVQAMARSATPEEIDSIAEPNLRTALITLRLERLADTAAVRRVVSALDGVAEAVRQLAVLRMRQLPDFEVRTARLADPGAVASWARSFGNSKEYRNVLRFWPKPLGFTFERPDKAGSSTVIARLAIPDVGALAELQINASCQQQGKKVETHKEDITWFLLTVAEATVEYEVTSFRCQVAGPSVKTFNDMVAQLRTLGFAPRDATLKESWTFNSYRHLRELSRKSTSMGEAILEARRSGSSPTSSGDSRSDRTAGDVPRAGTPTAAGSVTEIKKIDKVGGVQYYEVKCARRDDSKISFDDGYWRQGYMFPTKFWPSDGANSGRNTKTLEEVAKEVCR